MYKVGQKLKPLGPYQGHTYHFCWVVSLDKDGNPLCVQTDGTSGFKRNCEVNKRRVSKHNPEEYRYMRKYDGGREIIE